MPDFRAAPYHLLNALMSVPEAELSALAAKGISADAVWDFSWPIKTQEGPDGVIEGAVLPIRRALGHCRRRDEIFIGGANRREEGGFWCAAVTHYVGTFNAPLWGIRPSGKLVFLRAGEFHRVDGGRITKSRTIFDLPDLMRQAGRLPLPHVMGAEITFPGPATHDGVLPDAPGGEESADVVDNMIADLHAFDPDTYESPGQTGTGGYWHPRMMWYGPAGIGSNYLWDGFVRDHRAPFLDAFPDRKGGDHYCRIGDGAFAALSGWPSMTMTHRGPYLGMEPTDRPLTLRVMDFYRTEDRQLIENWVFLDFMHLFHQLGRDLIAESNEILPESP